MRRWVEGEAKARRDVTNKDPGKWLWRSRRKGVLLHDDDESHAIGTYVDVRMYYNPLKV